MIKSLCIKIQGMQCTGCEQIINETLQKLPGVVRVDASYMKGSVDVDIDDKLIDEQSVRASIKGKGYDVQLHREKSTISIFIFIVLLLLVGGVAFWGKSLMPNLLPQINAQMSNVMLFSIGFLTGFHCIGMCGSFIVSYSDQNMSKARSVLSHLFYGFGKTASYTAIGAAFGLLGSVITITSHMRGVAALAASVFLLIYGLKMLNIIPGLRYFTLRLPKAFTSQVNSSMRNKKSPLVIGLLSGLLLGCGPLQAMYIMAAGTGSPEEGATLLFFFGLGTLVPLLSFGFFANLLSRNTIHELVKVSGFLVIIMGVMMANRGLKLTQSGYDFGSIRGQIQQTFNKLD